MKTMRLGIGALVAAGFLLALSGAATADTRQALTHPSRRLAEADVTDA